MHCEKKGRKNSKRDTATCVEADCPLHPYRTGVLKARTGPIGEWTKQRNIAELERLRRSARAADRALEEERANLRKKQHAVEEQRRKVEEQQKKVQKAEKTAMDARKQVRDLEIEFTKQLEAGLWHSRKNMREEQSAPGAGTQGPGETSAVSTAPEDS
jgi:septal ring factor EnvC (AmiA/AmiB activator)